MCRRMAHLTEQALACRWSHSVLDTRAASPQHGVHFCSDHFPAAVQEFYAPIITAYEAHIAFAPGQEWTGDYRMDFSCLLVLTVVFDSIFLLDNPFDCIIHQSDSKGMLASSLLGPGVIRRH